MEPAASRRYSGVRRGGVPAGGAALCRYCHRRSNGLVLRHPALGIAIHAAGAEPRAVDKSAVSVTRTRYLGVMFAGFMSALAGAFLSIGDIHTFTEGMTRGAARDRGSHLRQMDTDRYCARLPSLWCSDGAAISVADARCQRSERLPDYVVLCVGTSCRRWFGWSFEFGRFRFSTDVVAARRIVPAGQKKPGINSGPS